MSFKHPKGSAVATPRQTQAVIIDAAISDGVIGPLGGKMYLTQDFGAAGDDGLSWIEEEKITP